MKKVYLLQHLTTTSDKVETVKIIGVYSNRTLAEQAVERLKMQSGFRGNSKIINPTQDDGPNGFFIDEYEVDKDHWQSGFSAN